MKRIAVVYATRHGHTRKVAEHLAIELRTRGFLVTEHDLAAPNRSFSLAGCAAVVLAASVHVGKHERAMGRFIAEHRAELALVPVVFVSVSLSERTVEDPGHSPEERAQAAAQLQEAIDRFLRPTGLAPWRVFPVAGALPYTRYNFFTRFIMKRIARAMRGPTDTTRDHQFTDWAALDRLCDEIAESLAEPRQAQPAA